MTEFPKQSGSETVTSGVRGSQGKQTADENLATLSRKAAQQIENIGVLEPRRQQKVAEIISSTLRPLLEENAGYVEKLNHISDLLGRGDKNVPLVKRIKDVVEELEEAKKVMAAFPRFRSSCTHESPYCVRCLYDYRATVQQFEKRVRAFLEGGRNG